MNVPIRLRWSDLDAYGHVNNVEMLRLLEEARIVALWADETTGERASSVRDETGADDSGAEGDGGGAELDSDAAVDSGEALGASTQVLDARPGTDTLSLIARQEIEYLAPVPYQRQPLDIQLWVGRIGGASLDLCYEVRSPAGAEPATLYARAATTLVLVDAASGRPRRINDRERAAWAPYEEPAIEFHRR